MTSGSSALGRGGDVWDYVLARVAIDFRREVTMEDDAVVVRTSLAHVGTSSLTLREECPEARRDARSRGRVCARRARSRDRPLATTDRRERATLQGASPRERPPQVGG